MAQFIPLDDPEDARLAPYTRMTDVDHRRAVDEADGTFVVEGVTAIRRALLSPYRLCSLLLTPAKASGLAIDLEGHDVDVYVVEPPTMNAVTGFDIHRGAVAIAIRHPLPAPAAVLSGASLVAVLEGLNDHENLGAVARSAAALRVDGMLLDATCADPLYRRCVRVSMGEILHLPYTRIAPWPAALDELRADGWAVVALTPDSRAAPIDAVAAELAGRPVALLLGSEGPGLSAAALAGADHRGRIPMRPGADSLNVGHAAAIAFHVLAARAH